MLAIKARLIAGVTAGLCVSILATQAAYAGSGGGSAKASVSRAPITSGCNGLNKMKVKTYNPAGDIFTTSTSFVDISGAGVSISVGGTTPSCVIVTYSGRVTALDGAGNEGMYVRPLMDSITDALPTNIVFTANDNSGLYDAHSFTWVFPSVSPGNHQVKMQFRSETGSSVSIFGHTVLVQYR